MRSLLTWLAQLFSPRRSFAYRTLEADRNEWKARSDRLQAKVDELHKLLLHSHGLSVERMNIPSEAMTTRSGRPSRREINQKYLDQFNEEALAAIVPQPQSVINGNPAPADSQTGD